MYSSSSATRSGGLGPVAELLAESLRALRLDVPACHQAARLALAGRATRCRIDDEQFVARFSRADIAIGSGAETAEIEVEVSGRTILTLLRGQGSLDVAVLSGALKVRGPIDDVAALARAMRSYLHGAVRSPAFPAILARFERITEPGRE